MISWIIILSIVAFVLVCTIAYNSWVREHMLDALGIAFEECLESDYDKFMGLELLWVCKHAGFKRYHIIAVESSIISNPEVPIAGMTILCKTAVGKVEEWYI